ncbi:MAG: aminotransferase class V-fold PLP-dependent enzyme [Synergistaceae bacterium]|nr:aminotransferase class V-fold PLP-dependent enzyme [Synergistaceae bacterium]
MDVYLNNAATTWPKPPGVAVAMADFLTRSGANLGRGSSSRRDLATLNMVLDCRIAISKLLGGYDDGNPQYVTFCSGVTEALNVTLKGFLRPLLADEARRKRGRIPRVLSTSMEHNAVVRPLRALEREGVSVVFLECGLEGALDSELLEKTLKGENGDFDLMVLSHASNVCGTVQPLEKIARLCRGAKLPLVVDTAQTAGLLPLSATELGVGALCFTGHKGLMGPQGIGGIVWNPEFASRVAPLVEGGTGSYSHVETQPLDMPDKFEAGTPNLPGIAGLCAALEWLDKQGIHAIAERENELGGRFLKELRETEGALLYGRPTMEGRLPVFSVNFLDPFGGFLDNGLLADRLLGLEGNGTEFYKSFETRPGLHCSPLAHRTLGTFPHGSLRISPGYGNKPEEIDALWEAMRSCIGKN